MNRATAPLAALAAALTAAALFIAPAAAIAAPRTPAAPAVTAAAARAATGLHLAPWQAHAAHVAHERHLEHLGRLAYLARLSAVSPGYRPASGRTRGIARNGIARVDQAPEDQAAAYSSPQDTAAAMLGAYGWPAAQMGCLIPLWDRESGWNAYAYNAGSGAYGIPQALPGSKMASAGADWRTDPATQIRWGLSYIAARYGSPCGAWDHEETAGWY